MSKQPASSKTGSEGERRGVSLYGSSVEYAIHCLRWLASRNAPASSRDLAELMGVSPAMMAKILPKLEKAGILSAQDGIAGGYQLARPAGEVTVLDIIEAVDGGKRVFDCKEIRQNCILFGGETPPWISHGVCAIHAVMLRAEKSMRKEMAATTLLDLASTVGAKAPASFGADGGRWLDARMAEREQTRLAAIRDGARRRATEG
ncbi:MAG: Rrf2 family transcriptional regulator [Pseudomonadota bacterium]